MTRTPAPEVGRPGSEHPPDLKRFSCLPCRQRKVKCDRRNPCFNCTKATKQCNFIPPVRGKPRKRVAPKEGLHAKLKRYEELLNFYGAEIELCDNRTSNGNVSDDGDASEPDDRMVVEESGSPKMSVSPFSSDETKTKLISKNGSSRYFDTGLWSNLADDFHQPIDQGISESLDASSTQTPDYHDESPQESGLVLNTTSRNDDLANLHFPSHILQKLFDKFRDNVDPLMKFLHVPTLFPTIRTAIDGPNNMSKSLAAITFAFYFTTITSLEEDECHTLFGEQKDLMTARYKNAARRALNNADFLKSSSLETLQAYSTFLMGMRAHNQSTSMYILSGIAVRLARRMGLHRDGTMLGLSTFETEMRRRLWWHIVQVDWQISDFSGTKPSMDLFLSDTKNPLNIEDEDISPNMTNPPIERIGITSVVLLSLRCDLMDFMRRMIPPLSDSPQWESLASSGIPLSEKDTMIKKMEDLLEGKYLRYYDPSNPLHYFSSILCRSSICKMRLKAHGPRQYASCGTKVPQSSRDIIWTSGMKMLEYASLSLSDPHLRRFTWQVSAGYLWDTLHCVLVEVRHRKMGPEVDRAWQLVGAVVEHYPQIFSETTDPLYAALRNWTLRVWDELVSSGESEGRPESPTPEFITAIRRCRRPAPRASFKPLAGAGPENATGTLGGNEFQPLGHEGNGNLPINSVETSDDYDFLNLLSFEMEPDEWMQWERLMSGQSF